MFRMASNPLSLRGERVLLVAALVIVALGASGCAVVSVAGAAAGAVVSVGGAVVGSTVKVAGKVVEKTIDVATPSGSTK